MINYRAEAAEAIVQAERYQKLEIINNTANEVSKNFVEHTSIIRECAKAYAERKNASYDKEHTLSQLNEIKTKGSQILDKIKELKDQPDWSFDSLYENNLELVNLIDDLINEIKNEKTANEFVSGLSDFYQFVENLSLLEHLVLLDIILFLLVMVTIINIFSALFANEIIKYFNLENRFPRLSLFFKIRLTLQKYYIIWNVFVLMVVCIFAVGINTTCLYLTLT